MWCPMDEGRGGVIVVAAGADAAACRRQVRQHGAVEGGLTVVSRKRNCISGSIRIFRVIHLDLIAILLLAASTAAVQDWDKKQQTRNTTDGTVGEVTVCVIGGPGFPPFVSSKVHVRISEVPEVTVYGVDEFLNAYEGLDVDLLLAILWMKFQKNHTVIRSHRDYNGLFMELRTRVCDIGIGAIARSYYRGQCVDCPEVPTSAEEFGKQHFCCMHLTDSYFEDGMAVASYTGMATMLDSIQEEFWKPPVLTAICVLALGLLMSGHLVWMLERKDNSKQFHRSYLDGVDDGVWWSFVTMATVGYGDKVPLTMTGRFIACLWMCIGILLFAVFNSAILLSMTSVTQARDISGFRDERLLLSGNTTICTVPNGLTEFLLQSNGLQPVTIFADSLKGCFQKMKKAAVKYIFFHRLPLLTASQDPSLGITEQIEVSKSFQTIQKTIAMHPEGWVNELVDEAMTELKAGARVYSPHAKFGFTMLDNEMVWTSFNRPLKYYVISNVHAGYQPEDYGKAYILMGFTLAVMFAYLTVKFGGLWLRRMMRLRELAKKGVDVHRLPFQDDILDGKTGRRGSIGAFIESSSLSQSINELRRQVNYLAASKQLENPSERDSGASGTDLPLDCVQWREANSERPPSGRGQTLPPVQQDDKRPKLCRTCSSYHLPSAQCRNIRASS